MRLPFDGLVPSTCKNTEVLQLWSRALEATVSYVSPEKFLSPALRTAQCVDAEVLGAFLALAGGTEGGKGKAASHLQRIGGIIAKAEEGGADKEAVEREKLLLQSMLLWAEGKVSEAVDVAEDQILRRWPLDMLTLRLVCDVHTMLGQPAAYLSVVQQVHKAWEHHTLERGYVDGMLAFGLQEMGEVELALQHGYRALEATKGRDAWALHAVVHSYYARGRSSEGLRCLHEYPGTWERADLLVEHMFWHKAVFLLDVGRPHLATEIYDKHLCAADVAPTSAFNVADAAGLVWRLSMLSDQLERAEAIVKGVIAGGHATARVWIFTTVHSLLAALLARNTALAEVILADVTQAAQTTQPKGFGTAARDVGKGLSLGAAAYARGDYNEATNCIHAVRGCLTDLGGSRAQRDLFEITLIDAALRSHNFELARSLVEERLHEYPHSASTWLMKANIEARGIHGVFDRDVLLTDSPEALKVEELEMHRSFFSLLPFGSLVLRRRRKRSRL